LHKQLRVLTAAATTTIHQPWSPIYSTS